MGKQLKRSISSYLETVNREYGSQFVEIPRSDCPIESLKALPIKAWRNNQFLVALYNDQGRMRLSVNRTTIKGFSRKTGAQWDDRISWEDLQQIKSAVGFGDAWAVECYPPDSAVVNVANMRHLWLLDRPPEFGWNRSSS